MVTIRAILQAVAQVPEVEAVGVEVEEAAADPGVVAVVAVGVAGAVAVVEAAEVVVVAVAAVAVAEMETSHPLIRLESQPLRSNVW